jgi:hypothetical protein
VLASITKKWEIEREIFSTFHIIDFGVWWPSQTLWTNQFVQLIISQLHKFIYNYSESTVRNTVDYSGQEKLFLEKHLSADRPRHQGDPRTGTLQEHTLTLRTVRWRSKHCPRPNADRPASGVDRSASENQKNPKVTGSLKCIFSVLADRSGCTTGPSATALSDIWRRIKCFIAIDIAVTTDRCDFSRWCAGADRPDQGRGPSAVGRKGAAARKWLGAINTTPTTSIHFTQALQSFTFNTRASNPFKDTIKASNLSKSHNLDKWSLVISDLRGWSVCYLSLLSLSFCNRAFFFSHSYSQVTCNQSKRHQVCGGPCGV